MSVGLTARFQVPAVLHRNNGETTRPDGTSAPATPTDITLSGCYAWPAGSTESTQGQDNVLTGLTFIAPAGTVIQSTDTVTVLGETFAVAGDPFEWLGYGVQVALTRAH